MSKRRVPAFCVAAMMLASALPAAADPIIFQSAIQQPTVVNGVSTFDGQFVGARFFVDSPVQTTSIGGHFTNTLDVFGALVRLSGAGDFPDTPDLSSPDVIGGARIFSFTYVYGTDIYTAPLAARLDRGWHALLFGSGLFGTVHSSWGGALPTQHHRIGAPRFFISDGLRADSTYRNMNFPALFSPLVFVEGAESLAPVPEPATLLLAGGGIAYLLRRRRQSGVERGA